MPAAPAPPAPLIAARWFDGRNSRGQRVLVGLHPGPDGTGLRLHPLAPAGQPTVAVPPAQIGWPERWGPRHRPARLVVDLGPQGSLEVEAVTEWEQAAAQAGPPLALSQRLQTRWRPLLLLALIAVLGLLLVYRHGTPWAATQLARWVPLAWEQDVANRVLRRLDPQLRPSRLGAERQASLQRQFDTLAQAAQPLGGRYPGYRPVLRLAVRAGGSANAFALPGGQIVVTDLLLEAALRPGLGDDAVLGVLAHEIGHVVHRHGTRLLIEQGVLNLGLALALGDVSGLLAHGSAVLTGLAYQRRHEREADCHAMRLMAQLGRSTEPMARLLGQLGRDGAGGPPAPRWGELLSSHPATPERVERLARQDTRDCERPGF